MAFNFKANWQNGSTNHAPDALFRNPVSIPSPEELLAESDEDNNQEPSAAEIRASTRLEELRKIAKADDEYQ